VVSAAAPALAAPPSLSVLPGAVRAGYPVVVRGSADGCSVGATVLLLSRAFVHRHDFAGVPAVFAKVRKGGAFETRTTIPASRKAGTYGITARCAGGNLGVLVRLRVKR
jgi:hypothetical protein